jgi:hypothetical protein
MDTQSIMKSVKDIARRGKAWALQEEHQRQVRELRDQAHRAFTEHPEETGETYWEHLWFTFTMSMRFFLTTLVILIHGIFPFLLVRTASNHIETIYRIMKSRIPKSRRETIDADYQL